MPFFDGGAESYFNFVLKTKMRTCDGVECSLLVTVFSFHGRLKDTPYRVNSRRRKFSALVPDAAGGIHVAAGAPSRLDGVAAFVTADDVFDESGAVGTDAPAGEKFVAIMAFAAVGVEAVA